jgi:glycosyltransferase involved in cell wall biosynthesis
MEGWGITVIEANACGTPAVVADSPGLRVAVVDGVSGSVVAVEAMAEEILRVLTDTQLRERLAAGASRRAAFFSWDRAAKRMLAAIRRELEASRRS